jgi:pyridoxamine 5'-phosphate oxidase
LAQVDPDPLVQFDRWFQEACAAMPVNLANSMVLATAGANHQPSARIVLLKEYSAQGFIFYSNYQSRKGREIAENPHVALLFWWEALERQVRIEGKIKKLSAEKSTEYFHTRPRGAQIAALISQQSQPLPDLAAFQNHYQQRCQQYAEETTIPRPEHWGGYLVLPEHFEFWQGRENRLHDRFQYNKNPNGQWAITRLFP